MELNILTAGKVSLRVNKINRLKFKNIFLEEMEILPRYFPFLSLISNENQEISYWIEDSNAKLTFEIKSGGGLIMVGHDEITILLDKF